jgi:hypothetical protein
MRRLLFGMPVPPKLPEEKAPIKSQRKGDLPDFPGRPPF